jgi:hypothetical protein
MYADRIGELESERHTANRMAIAANIAFEGGNDCRVAFKINKTSINALYILNRYPLQEEC